MHPTDCASWVSNKLECIETLAEFFCDGVWTKESCIHLFVRSFLAQKVLFQDLGANYKSIWVGMLAIVYIFLLFLGLFDVGLRFLNDPLPVICLQFEGSSVVSLHLVVLAMSRSIGKVALRPNMTSKRDDS